jgi:hypothetical protein
VGKKEFVGKLVRPPLSPVRLEEAHRRVLLRRVLIILHVELFDRRHVFRVSVGLEPVHHVEVVQKIFLRGWEEAFHDGAVIVKLAEKKLLGEELHLVIEPAGHPPAKVLFGCADLGFGI